jgi:hypothetical protein
VIERVICNGVDVTNFQTLQECGFPPEMKDAGESLLEFFLASRGAGGKLGPENIMEVNVTLEDGTQKQIMVQVLNENRRKLYLGGYRHKKTGVEYHHAAIQTLPEPRKWDSSNKNHRDTQTYDEKTRSIQTTREHGTQMIRPDLDLDFSKDRELAPREYFDSSAWAERRLRNTIIIECYWRGYIARKCAWNLREKQFQKQEAQLRLEEEQAEKSQAQHRREIQRRMHPRTYEDFEILYNELENWRYHETERITNNARDERERLAALAQLLHKETKLLQVYLS